MGKEGGDIQALTASTYKQRGERRTPLKSGCRGDLGLDKKKNQRELRKPKNLLQVRQGKDEGECMAVSREKKKQAAGKKVEQGGWGRTI